MKPYFAKELVERERLKPYDPNAKDRFSFSYNSGWNEDLDDDYDNFDRSLLSDHKRYFSGKRLNENLNPLYNFLKHSVGKKWNDVYSEIRENINFNNAIQLHILEHLKWFVIQDPVEIEKRITGARSQWGKPNFYVDDEGFLKQFPQKAKIKAAKDIPKRIVLGKAENNLIWLNRFDKKDFSENEHVIHNNEVALYFLSSKNIWYKVIWRQVFGDFLATFWEHGYNKFYKYPEHHLDFYNLMKAWSPHWVAPYTRFPKIEIENRKGFFNFGPDFVSVTKKELKEIKKIINQE